MESYQLPNISSAIGLAVTITLSVLASLAISIIPVLLIYRLNKQPISRIPTEKDIKRIDELELAVKAIEEEMIAKRRNFFTSKRVYEKVISLMIMQSYPRFN
ncbi:hypothetical protein LOAG_10446 [Loa loa]|uniref:Col_cuticle_N domain-containing protein n=1 Tax=Loa loa TaxID=7209 RepID=A0A1I7V601_LOALO|nr:hypothetical protein LOAG_10446 [Loa loa]EFO18052.1 hypothetical protein LOAG_10446 [Loa loa]